MKFNHLIKPLISIQITTRKILYATQRGAKKVPLANSKMKEITVSEN